MAEQHSGTEERAHSDRTTHELKQIWGEFTLHGSDTSLLKAVQAQNVVRTVSTLTPLNKWIINIRVWYLNGQLKILFHYGEDCEDQEYGLGHRVQASADTNKKYILEAEISFLKECMHQYLAKIAFENSIQASKTVSRASQSSSMQTDDTALAKFYHIELASFIVTENSAPVSAVVSSNKSSPYKKFSIIFHQVLEQKYGHLEENQIFGDSSEMKGPVLIVNDFEDLLNCESFDNYKQFFSTHFELLNSLSDQGKQFFESFQVWFDALPRDSNCSAEVNKHIIDEVKKFSAYLIDIRLQTSQLFEKFELRLFRKFTSYDFMKSSEYTKMQEHLEKVGSISEAKINSVCPNHKEVFEERSSMLRAIKKLNEMHEACLLHSSDTRNTSLMCSWDTVHELEIELYDSFLSGVVMDIPDIETKEKVRQCLKSTKNHFSYLHKHLERLTELFSIFLKPHQITQIDRNASQQSIFSITMVASTLSSALAAFSRWLSNNQCKLSKGDEVRICADTVLYVDTDMGYSDLAVNGINISLFAPQLPIMKKSKVRIKTDGKNLEPIYRLTSAKSGTPGTKDRKDGQPGSDGENGRYGNAGGHILLVASNINYDEYDLSADGSPGEDGQHGGNGGDGWSPTEEGKNGEEPTFEQGHFKTEDSVVISFGEHGQNSGQGGNAGMGGAAGKSGISGKIELLDLSNGDSYHCNQKEIEDGKEGNPGVPGKGGKHTRHGIDWGKYGRSLSFTERFETFFTRGRPKASIEGVRGELSHPAVPYKPGETSEQPGVGLPVQCKREDHPDFLDRGTNKSGSAAQTKINTNLAKENKAIDKQACFQTARNQCQKTLQHWNRGSHNHLINGFARRIGEQYQSIHFAHTSRSEVIRASKDIWISRLSELHSEPTRIAVTHETRQVERLQYQLVKDYDEQSKHTPLSYMAATTSVEPHDQDVTLDASSFKDRAKLQGVTCEPFHMSAILKTGGDSTSEFLLKLKLSRQPIYIVTVSSSEKAVRCYTKYMFIVINNLSSNTWIFYHSFGKHSLQIDTETVADVLEDVTVVVEKENDPKEIVFDFPENYDEFVTWINNKLRNEFVIPCTSEQLLFIWQLNLIVMIRNTYLLLSRKCDREQLSLLQYTTATNLQQVAISTSIDSVNVIKKTMHSKHLLLTPIDMPWIETDQKATVCSRISDYNESPTLSRLVDIVIGFQEFHYSCLTRTTKRESYLTYLSEGGEIEVNRLFSQLLHHINVIGEKMKDLDSKFKGSLEFIVNMLPIIPALGEDELVKEHLRIKDWCATIQAKVIKSRKIIKNFVEDKLDEFVSVMQKVWDISITDFPVSESVSRRIITVTFKETFLAFCACPTLDGMVKAIDSFKAVKTPASSTNANQLVQLISYAFEKVHMSLRKFHPQMPVHEFASTFPLNVKELNPKVTSILLHVPDIQPFTHLLEHVDWLFSEYKQDKCATTMDPLTLLLTIPEMLKDIFKFYNDLFCKDENEEKAVKEVIKTNIQQIETLRRTLFKYPMSCPLPALNEWIRYLSDELADKLKKKREIFNTDLGKKNNLLGHLDQLRSEINKCAQSIEKLVNRLEKLHIARFAENLESFLMLYGSDEQSLGIYTMQCQYGLPQIPSPCLETLADWISPGLLGISKYKLSIEMKRLHPKNEVLVLPDMPDHVPTNTLIIFQKQNKWQYCCQDDHEQNIVSCRDIDIPENILPKKVLTEYGSSNFSLSKEEKAAILDKLRHEDEHRVSLKIQYCHQLIVGGSFGFILAIINLGTCKVEVYSECPSKNDPDWISNIVILYCHTKFKSKAEVSSEWLPRLGMPATELQQLTSELMEGKITSVFLLKHPDQPVTTRTVTNCGDKADLNILYSTPLVTEETTASFSEQFQPLSSLIEQYNLSYHPFLPKDMLNKVLRGVLKAAPKLIFPFDIERQVRLIRCQFILTVMETLFEADRWRCTIKQTINCMLLPDCKFQVMKEFHLLGLESYLKFLLVRSNSQLMMINLDTDDDELYYWQKFDLNAQNSLLVFRALTYLIKQDTSSLAEVEEQLCSHKVSVKYELLHSIVEGLKIIQPHVQERSNSLLEICLSKAINFSRRYKLEYLWEVSKTLDDMRNPHSLLSLILSVETLCQRALESDCLANIKHSDLKSRYFYTELSSIVLSWCNDEIHKIAQVLQNIVSKCVLVDDEPKECLLDCFISRNTAKIEFFLLKFDWDNVYRLMIITQIIMKKVNSAYLKCLQLQNSQTCLQNFSEIVTSSLKLVKILSISSDLTEVIKILHEAPSELCLKQLLIHSMMTLFENYYQIKISDQLYDELMKVDQGLLQILHNVFIDDQYNKKKSSDTVDSNMVLLTYDQLQHIIEWLPYIENCPVAYSILCRTSISLWERELAEIHFKQYVDHWKGLSSSEKRQILYMLNRVRLNSTISHTEFMSLLNKIQRECVSGDHKNLPFVILLFEDLYYNRVSLRDVYTLVYGYDCVQWPVQLNLLKGKLKNDLMPRSVEEVLKLIEEEIHSGDYDISLAMFRQIEDEASKVVTEIKSTCESAWYDYPAHHESIQKFLGVLERVTGRARKVKWLKVKENRVFFVVHIIKAWILATSEDGKMQVPYNTQIVSLLLFMHTSNQGLLQQVKTGEGKTLIVAMLAASKALLGYYVDVVSSNRDLAQDGMRKCQSFFNLLGLQAAVNCTGDEDTDQQAYKSHIVYGDVQSFQGDVLNKEWKTGGSSFGNRYSNSSRNCLIVDEVDSMFLDKGRHMLYRSRESSALKHLESLFVMIWSTISGISSHADNEQLNEVADQLIALIENGVITVPEYLREFCQKKMKYWVQSAFRARMMNADDEFVIDSRGKSQVKQIFPIDKQTGIEQYNMKWSNGLSQFLELKYRRPLSTESLRAIFISNKRFFQKYGMELFGLTGTLGSISSRKLLQEVYKIKTVQLPTNRSKLYIQAKSRVATASENMEWCRQIKEEVLSRCKQQPVLIICESIKRLQVIKQHLNSCDGIRDIIDYARDGDDIENKFEKQGGAQPGQIVLATNKGGRGTDILINDHRVKKGLHVIVTFLPLNTRIEEQAFGRAARAGQAGSGCLIIQYNPSKYRSLKKEFGTIEAATETLVEMEKIKRDRAETERLSRLLNEELPKLDLEEKLYKLFQQHRRTFSSRLRRTNIFGDAGGENVRKAYITIFTNRWAYWLESMHGQMRDADSVRKRQDVKKLFDDEFSSISPSESLSSDFFKMPEDYILLGQAFLVNIEQLKKMKKKKNETESRMHQMYSLALPCFEQAAERGDRTGLPAMVACYCYIKLNSDPTPSNKKQARSYLKEARLHLDFLKQSWMVNVGASKYLSNLVDVSQHVHIEENHYTKQLEEKLKVIGLHLNIVDTLIGTSINPNSFINDSTEDRKQIDEGRSREIYYRLCETGILCHHKVRSCWRKSTEIEQIIKSDPRIKPHVAYGLMKLILQKKIKNDEDLKDLIQKHLTDSGLSDLESIEELLCTRLSGKDKTIVVRSWIKSRDLEEIIRNEVEAHIAEALIKLLQQNPNVHEGDLEILVYNSEELWEILHPLMRPTEQVVIFKVDQINSTLEDDELKLLWTKLCEDCHIENIPECVLLNDENWKRYAKEQERLISQLENNGLCIETRRGELLPNAVHQIQDLCLGKYEVCKVCDEIANDEQKKTLRELLKDLISFCQKREKNFLYEHMLPFGKVCQEAKKLFTFLQQKEIVKSGKLMKHKYGGKDSGLKTSVKHALDDRYTDQQLEYVISILRKSQGEICKFERKMTVDFVDFYELKDRPKDIPGELTFFSDWYMDHFLTLEQVDRHWDWNAFACAMLGIAQIVAGVALMIIPYGFFLGGPLIGSGLSDIAYAILAGITDTFNWKDYAIQKRATLPLLVGTLGLSVFKHTYQYSRKIGSASRLSTFIRTTAKAAGEFAISTSRSLLSNIVLANVRTHVIDAILGHLTETLHSVMRDTIRSQLLQVAREVNFNRNEFQEKLQQILENLKSDFQQASNVSSEFEQLRHRLVSSVNQQYRQIVEELRVTDSPLRKMVGRGRNEQVAVLADAVLTSVNEDIDVEHIANSMVDLAGLERETSPLVVSDHSDQDIEELIKTGQDEIEARLQSIFQFDNVRETFRKELDSAIKNSLKHVAKASMTVVSNKVDTSMKTSSQLVRDQVTQHKSKTDTESQESTESKRKPKVPGEEAQKQNAYLEKRDAFQTDILEPDRPEKPLKLVSVPCIPLPQLMPEQSGGNGLYKYSEEYTQKMILIHSTQRKTAQQ